MARHTKGAGLTVARTAHTKAVDDLVNVAYDCEAELLRAATFYDPNLMKLVDAIVKVRTTKGPIGAPTVYVPYHSTATQRMAALVSIASRSEWRALVYEVIARFMPIGLSDRGIEAELRVWWANVSKIGQNAITCYHLGPTGPGGASRCIRIPGDPKHETISSARYSLVKAGLIVAKGTEFVGRTSHQLWVTAP